MHSIVEYYAEHESYKCGYCKSPDTNFSHGMWAHTMTVSDYQDLIDRGWRRSGKYCYKPSMSVTCCPMYTISCKALEFKLSKSQKKVFKTVNKYLSGQEPSLGQGGDRKMSTGSSNSEQIESGDGMEQFVEVKKSHQDINVNDVQQQEVNMMGLGDCEERQAKGEGLQNNLVVNIQEKSDQKEVDVNYSKTVNKSSRVDPNKGPCKKAKQLRMERKLEKLKEKGINMEEMNKTNKCKEKSVEDFINELPDEYQKRLQIKLVRTTPPSAEYLATSKETHEVYVKYQMTIHGDKPDACTESRFKDFLVQSPLLEEHSETGPPCGFGSFHQQYWLDGKLIAVGVIDILPKCVSSVYFFYDPQYRHLTLGTYGALREIAFTRQLHETAPELKYYYMGFYIHSCRKMRYKGNFTPSDLLCPETYNWVPLKDCLEKLEASPYSRLDPDIDALDNNSPHESNINYIPVLVKGVVMPYKIFKRKYSGKKVDDTQTLMEYAELVGAKAAKSLILVYYEPEEYRREDKEKRCDWCI